MSHLTTELCEKYPGERIQQWEYDLVAKEWAAIGFFPTAFADRAKLRLPEGSFFSQTGTKEDVLRAWGRIRSRLGRKVRLECTIGYSFGKDLDSAGAPSVVIPETRTPAIRPAWSPENVLSNAFNKLFKPHLLAGKSD